MWGTASGESLLGHRNTGLIHPNIFRSLNCHFPTWLLGFLAELQLYGLNAPILGTKVNNNSRGVTRVDSQSDSYRLQETKWAELLAPGNLRTQPDSLAREPPSFLWAETCLPRDGSVNSTDWRQTSHSVSAPSAIARGAFYRARHQLGARVWPFFKENVSYSPPIPAF